MAKRRPRRFEELYLQHLKDDIVLALQVIFYLLVLHFGVNWGFLSWLLSKGVQHYVSNLRQ